MAKKTPKDDPNLFFFGSMVDLDCHIQDLKLVLKRTEELDFDDHPEATPELQEEGLIADIFPGIARESFIVSLLITLENEFKCFCNLLREIEDIPLKWTELRGSALDRFKIYCNKVAGLNVPDAEPIVSQVRGLIEVRNCIVHSNSSIENYGKAKTIEQFMESVSGVSVVDEHYLSFTYESCIQCATIVMEYMEKWYRAALSRYPKEDKK